MNFESGDILREIISTRNVAYDLCNIEEVENKSNSLLRSTEF